MKLDFEKVAEFIQPTVDQFLAMDGGKSGLYILVANGDKTADLEKSIIWNYSIGDFGNCNEIAMAKARVSWRTGYTSQSASHRADVLLETGDSVWAGAVPLTIGDRRMVVAVSGLKERHDEALAEFVMLVMDMFSDDAVDEAKRSNGGMI